MLRGRARGRARTLTRRWTARYRRDAAAAGHGAAARGAGAAAVRAVARRLAPVVLLPHWVEKALYATGLRTARALTLPDFLCIGVEKAGTSWLYENLRRHPDIYLPAKELRYFDRDFHRPLRRYARRFAAGAGRIRGDVTPTYAVLPPSRIRFIRAVMPDVRLVLMLRDPVERAWSYALMYLVQGPGRRVEDVDEAEFLAHFRSERSRGRGRYTEILDRWLAVFPPERLLVVFFEQLAQAPADLLRQVFRHVGVAADVPLANFPLRRVVNPGPGVPLPDRYRAALAALYHDEVERLHRRFGAAVAGWRTP